MASKFWKKYSVRVVLPIGFIFLGWAVMLALQPLLPPRPDQQLIIDEISRLTELKDRYPNFTNAEVIRDYAVSTTTGFETVRLSNGDDVMYLRVYWRRSAAEDIASICRIVLVSKYRKEMDTIFLGDCD